MQKKRQSFLLKHTLISMLGLWALIAIGVLIAAPLTVRLSLFQPDLNAHHVKAAAEILETQGTNRTPEESVQALSGDAPADRAGDFFVVDDQGNILASSYGARLELPLDPHALPKKGMQVTTLNHDVPDPGSPAVIRLSKFPNRFLIFRPKARTGPEQFMMVAILIFVSLLLFAATAGSSYILLRKLRKHANEAAEVMNRIQGGELGARLHVERPDEFGTMMAQFNRMANEVERLFERNREIEKSRIHLLQDIGHDLRTPLGSLLNLLEMVYEKSNKLSEVEMRALLATGRREVRFTQRLVDDLLFLARVEDPSCLRNDSWIDLAAVLRNEIESKRQISSVEIVGQIPEEFFIFADSQLLLRMIRNALDNSLGFAEAKIHVRLKSIEGGISIEIEDDGPGFSSEGLAFFGQKRPTRIVHAEGDHRISLGLGSVIMVAIAKLYNGAATPSNRESIKGGRVTLVLLTPVSNSAPAQAS